MAFSGPVEAKGFSSSPIAWDFTRGFLDWRLWAFLGLQDVRQRYRRSALGPLWLTLGLGATVIGIGLLYSAILKAKVGTYIPFISISLLVWTLVSTIILESTTLYQVVIGVITSVKVPYTSFVLRVIMRNLIVSAHSVIVVVIAFLWFRYPIGVEALAALPGLILDCANLYWMALLIGLISARFRDIAQIVIYAMQIMLFLTPVIWEPTTLRFGTPVLTMNPLEQMLQVVRAPIFYHTIPVYSFTYCSVMLVLGMIVTVFTFSKSRRYLVYWI